MDRIIPPFSGFTHFDKEGYGEGGKGGMGMILGRKVGVCISLVGRYCQIYS
jgi:hypothetical protein